MELPVVETEAWAKRAARREEAARAAEAGILRRYWPLLATAVVIALAVPSLLEVRSGRLDWTSLLPPVVLVALLLRLQARYARRSSELLAEGVTVADEPPPRAAVAAARRAVARTSDARSPKVEAVKRLRSEAPGLQLATAQRLVGHVTERSG